MSRACRVPCVVRVVRLRAIQQCDQQRIQENGKVTVMLAVDGNGFHVLSPPDVVRSHHPPPTTHHFFSVFW
jgi:hypothetical protein